MFTAITGAEAQQVRIDVIANNLANLATVGFKRDTAQFQDLLYETVRVAAEEAGSPTGLQFGKGTRIVATQKIHGDGTQRQTGRDLDLAISGLGFFGIRQLNGEIAYTRDGALRVNVNGELVNAQGLLIDPPITGLEDATQITINLDGTVEIRDATGGTSTDQMQLFTFSNPSGLEAIGQNLFLETPGSGPPTQGIPGENGVGTISQGMLEESNVNIAEELVALILAQRAFEANTRVISASDDMLRFVTQR
jgi:flagellar basal-body rod protein FlgG